jgi:hypothetical protein
MTDVITIEPGYELKQLDVEVYGNDKKGENSRTWI